MPALHAGRVQFDSHLTPWLRFPADSLIPPRQYFEIFQEASSKILLNSALKMASRLCVSEVLISTLRHNPEEQQQSSSPPWEPQISLLSSALSSSTQRIRSHMTSTVEAMSLNKSRIKPHSCHILSWQRPGHASSIVPWGSAWLYSICSIFQNRKTQSVTSKSNLHATHYLVPISYGAT
jgi:hypothetical protein